MKIARCMKRFNYYIIPAIGLSLGYLDKQITIHFPFIILIINTLKQSDYDNRNQW